MVGHKFEPLVVHYSLALSRLLEECIPVVEYTLLVGYTLGPSSWRLVQCNSVARSYSAGKLVASS